MESEEKRLRIHRNMNAQIAHTSISNCAFNAQCMRNRKKGNEMGLIRGD